MAERISEIKTIDIERCIPPNPVYLRWLNTLGGWTSWLFGTRQIVTYDVDGKELFTKNITELENMNGLDEWVGKEAEKVLKLGYENLPTNKVELIKGILYSPKVYQVEWDTTVNPPLIKRTVVRVKPGSFSIIDTGDNRHDLEIQIIYPRLFIQQQ